MMKWYSAALTAFLLFLPSPELKTPSHAVKSSPATAPRAVANASQSLSDVHLVWDANSETDLAGYRVYRRTASGSYVFGTGFIGTVGVTPTPNYADQAVPDGFYYYVVTAYNAAGEESGPSNEVSTSVPTNVGPPGPVGPQGPQGPAGPTGAAGAKGATGATGAAGPAGPQGLQGPQGPTGAAGPQGPAGAQGDKGDPGIQGSMGMPGPQGIQGPPGPQGLRGLPGNPGPAGPAGALGTMPDIHGPMCVYSSSTAVEMTWHTRIATTARIEYQAPGGPFTSLVVDPVAVTDHYVRITGLSAGKIYSYTVINDAATEHFNAQGSFRTR
jgi:hypothetical protein